MKPSAYNQKIWARHLSSGIAFEPSKGSWQLLQDFTLPLISDKASSFHQHGIRTLGLNLPQCPDFVSFKNQVLTKTGWKLVESHEELSAPQFFALLATKSFPCVSKLRPENEVFAASKPDFWHEAIGHIALLATPESADFYQWCGCIVTGLYQDRGPLLAKKVENILWVLLEYGLLKEQNSVRSFGAALTGSYMALQRLRHQVIAPKGNWSCEEILASRSFEDGAPIYRNTQGQIVFFLSTNLQEIQEKILHFINITTTH